MRKQKGITLIALVITIIVLLILAAVSITALTDEDKGVVTKAKQAAEKTKGAAEKENQDIQEILDYTDNEFENENNNDNDNSSVVVSKNAIFSDGTELTWEELKLASNGSKYNYNASVITNTEIGNNAFENCDKLVGIKIPEGITKIGSSAFTYCWSLENVTFPNTLEIIGGSAFHCTGITNIEFPSSLTTIEDYAFFDTGIKTFNVPSNVTSIGNLAFFHFENINVDASNPNYSSIDGVLYNKNQTTLIKYPYERNVDSYVMPDSVTNIEYLAFSYQEGPKSITINNNVTVDGITFDEAYALEAIYVKTGNTKYVSSNGVLYTKDMTKLVKYPYSKSDSTYTVPSSVNTIGVAAFYQGYGPANLILQQPVIIEDSAFSESAFETITLPANIDAEIIYNLMSFNLTTINYGGTKAQWNSLELDERWNEMLEFIPIEQIVCSDGTISVR